MPTTTRRSTPVRSLVFFFVILGIVFGVVTAGTLFSDATWRPNLALDLEGGTQIILTPDVEGDEAVPSESVEQAVEIIRQRVNGSGVTEAEVTRQGTSNILVALPGNPDDETRDLVRRSAQLSFRPVLLTGAGFSLEDLPSGDETGSDAGGAIDDEAGDESEPSVGLPDSDATPDESVVAPEETSGDEPSPADNGRPAPRVTLPSAGTGQAAPAGAINASGTAAAGTADAGTTDTGATDPEPAGDTATGGVPTDVAPEPALGTEPTAEPTDASDPAWLTPAVLAEFEALDCLAEDVLAGGREGDPEAAFVTCSQDGTEKYVLGPVELTGESVDDATAGLETNQSGFSTGAWQVQLEFDSDAAQAFSELSTRLFGLSGDRNRFAIVLDGLVVSAPGIQEPIPGGQASITGNFTQESAQTLANQLRFGALPISFTVETEEQISATLGAEQLQLSLLAGVIGLALVVVYSVLQYRALGLVTVASLTAAALLTYGFLLFLSWRQGYRLSLPGVAGLIVAIGITADSFIVFFERIRDEVRDGRSLATAVEVGWERARRTILASDTVSFLAAIVLYLLAVGGVRGFAFTLGLTTLVDLIVVFLFTKPVVTLLSRTKFFASGHRLSGFDPERLGSVVAREAVRGRSRPDVSSRGRARPGSDRTTEGARV